MVTLCSNLDRGVFVTVTGSGIPAGMVRLSAKGASRDGEVMTLGEAQRIGLEEGFLIEFRSTDSFLNLCRSFLHHHSLESFEDLCRREEVDPAAIRAQLGRT